MNKNDLQGYGDPNDEGESALKTTLKTKGSAGGFSVYFAQCCGACHGERKSTRREFSEQAWAALVSWGEVTEQTVDEPLCNECYGNLRDVLIDRSDEIMTLVARPGNAVHRGNQVRAAIG